MKRIVKFLIIIALSLISSENLNATVTCDVNNDNKTGLEEAVYALQVVSGKQPSVVPSSIIGSWGTGFFPSGTQLVGEPEYVSLTFYPNGYYIHYETGQASEPCDNGGGVEYGTYTFNVSTQQIAVSPIVDNNGCVGLSENGIGGTYSVTLRGDLLQFDGDSFWLQRVQDINLPIVGSWGKGYFSSGTQGGAEPEYVSLTFYPNGYYIHYETGQASEPWVV